MPDERIYAETLAQTPMHQSLLGSDGVAVSIYAYYHLEGSKLVVELSLAENYEQNAASPWLRGSIGTDETVEPITQEEFASERAQYIRLLSLHFTSLSQME